MARPYTGLTASIKIDGEIVAYVSGVDLTLEKDIIEILAFGFTYKEKVPAVKDWSASIDGTVAIEAGNTQETLYNAFESGDLLTIGIFLDDNNYFEGTGYVSSFNISAAPDDKINLSSEIAGSGALLLTLADYVALTGIGAITGTPTEEQTLTAGALTPVGATVTYQWKSSAVSGGPYSNISGAVANTLLLTTAMVGRYIVVQATGAGLYQGTVTSAEVGPVVAL